MADPSLIESDAPLSIPCAQTGSLRKLAIRGAMWTVFGFGGSQVLRLVFSLIVTRLLYPELFGLISLVYTIVSGLALFCDLGITATVIRDPRGDDPEFLNTAWTMQIIRGAGLALMCLVLAWPVSRFYGDRRLAWIIPVIGFSNFVSGFNSTSLMALRRHMRVSLQVIVELGTQLVSGVVMIVWAWLSPTIWALIAGSVVAAIVRMIWSHLLLNGRADRLAYDGGALKALWHFGGWVWISSVLTFFASQSDRLILAKLLSWKMLGIYGLAAGLAELPRSLVFALNSDVIYPAYARSADLLRVDLRARILRHRWPLLIAMAFGVAALTVGGDRVLLLLYDKRYASGAWMLCLLALGIWPSALSNTIDSSLFAVGRPRYAASGNLSKVIFTVAAIPVAFRLMGTTGAVIAVALNDLPYYGVIAYGLRQEGLSTLSQDVKATALVTALIAAGLWLRYALGFGIPLRASF